MGRKALDRPAFEEHGPAVGQLEARYEVDRSALAGAVRTDEAGHLPQWSLERACVYGDHASEPFREPSHLEDGAGDRFVHAISGAMSVAGCAGWRSTNPRSVERRRGQAARVGGRRIGAQAASLVA